MSRLTAVGRYGSAFFGLFATALIWVGTIYFINHEHYQAERAALQNGANLARAFEEQIVRSIRAVDQTLLYVRDSYAKDPEHFNASLWSRNQFLKDFAFQVSVIDRDGNLVANNLGGAPAGLNFSDREHFRVHLERPADELFISAPVFGRVSGKWSIQLTRRINNPDGSFGGIVVVSLDPDYLSKFYETIDVGKFGSVTVLGTDGIVRARGASGAPAVGASVAIGPLLERLAQAGAGAFEGQSQVDGVDRIFSYRGVKGYPLVVVVGLARSEAFGPYEHNRLTCLMVATILSAVLFVTTVTIMRYQSGLARARDLAEAGTRARSEFLAMMSHEIRTPLNGVIGMAELLIDSGLNEEQLPLTRTLRDSAEHLLCIVSDVLDFSKLDADRVELEQIPFDLRELLNGTLEILSPRARAKGLDLSATISPRIPQRLCGDPARLRQILLNLIGNGIKFTASGGVSVAADLDEEAAADRVRLVITVSDTGIGIAEDAIGRLFREFSQVDSSISRRFGGTGLGLAICKRLVDLMGGTIAAESRVGHGTTFRFSVGLRAETANRHPDPDRDLPAGATSSPERTVPTRADPSTRILLVEDNQTNQLVAAKFLQTMGLAVTVVNDGAAAVAACTSAAYDVVLMDVMMPGMDGLSATRAIRKLPAPNGQCHIIGLTANALPSDRQDCLEAGMNDFLAKPMTRAGLAAKLGVVTAAPPRPTSAAAEVDAVFEPGIYRELEESIGAESADAVLQRFLGDMSERLDVIRRNQLAGDVDGIILEAHTAKSAAAMFGLMKLSEMARKMEKNAAQLDRASLADRIDEMQEAYCEACAHISRDLAAKRAA